MAMVSSLTVGSLPVKATGSFEEHVHLFRTIQSQGVRVVINHKQECADGRDGSYHSRERLLVICQDNARPGQTEIDWTANDLDTLRHEAHHMIQDCVLGSVADGQLGLLFSDRQELDTFIKESLGEQNAERLMQVPSYSGHNEYRQLIELEAFATAAVITPNDIVDMMNKVCK